MAFGDEVFAKKLLEITDAYTLERVGLLTTPM
jgi:hypothetical protein